MRINSFWNEFGTKLVPLVLRRRVTVLVAVFFVLLTVKSRRMLFSVTE
jgi:hypothetical protein